MPSPWHDADIEAAAMWMVVVRDPGRGHDLLREEAVGAAITRSIETYRHPDGSYTVGARYRCLTAKA
ncbi:hypothetical protein Q0M94_06520 [Deinococcus radiomollis]|uniref:hypothetical protein n=1 Tax=Deinococcus radiomollis TaxID=468916 RepID=UPI003891C353